MTNVNCFLLSHSCVLIRHSKHLYIKHSHDNLMSDRGYNKQITENKLIILIYKRHVSLNDFKNV